MKTVITSSGETIDSAFDTRFGRAEWFCVFDEKSGEVSFVSNANTSASNGAGTKAAEKMVDLGVTKVISGDFGPKAKDLLEKFDIQMVIMQNDELSVAEIIQKLKH